MVSLVINEVNVTLQMTLTQISNSIICSNYFGDSPRVASLVLTIESVCYNQSSSSAKK